MTWRRKSGWQLAIRSELGTVMTSTPAVERVRRRKVLPVLRSSIEATVTGVLRKSWVRTGASRMRSRSCLATGLSEGGDSRARVVVVQNAVAPVAAVARRKLRRVVGMGRDCNAG